MEIRISENCSDCYWKDQFLAWARNTEAAVEQLEEDDDIVIDRDGSFT